MENTDTHPINSVRHEVQQAALAAARKCAPNAPSVRGSYSSLDTLLNVEDTCYPIVVAAPSASCAKNNSFA